MAKKQTPPLTEDEIRSTYRNEFYTMDSTGYFRHRCTGSKQCYRILRMAERPRDNHNKAIKAMIRQFLSK